MISASMVNELRQKTGAGMMDCKKALQESNGDMEAALDWLRKKGLAAAAKKAGRVACEGLVAIKLDDSGKKGVVIELNSETDFVAKNQDFQQLCLGIVQDYLHYKGNDDAFMTSASSLSGKSVADEIAERIGRIGENISLRRKQILQVDQGVVVSYLHSQIAPGLGKIGVLVAFESDINPVEVQALGKQIAMHIAAARPESLSVADLDRTSVEKEKAFLREQAASSGKPAEVIEKMIEGRIAKFYEQVVLLEQAFVIDGKTKISQVLQDFAKEKGGKIGIKQFVCFALGEGIEQAAE